MKAGDVVSYLEMCAVRGVNLQRGMNFRLGGQSSLILMSLRHGAPYADRIENAGRILVYEGHDVPRTTAIPEPKRVDQEAFLPSGKATQNGLFMQAVENYKKGVAGPELVEVFEKIRPGIWVYNGLFQLIDAWQEKAAIRKVFKFKLQIIDQLVQEGYQERPTQDHDRIIPSSVKIEVWKRDGGKCVQCGTKENLHFDHIIPYSEGGSSKDPRNIQILCGRHNIQKSDRIQ